MNADFLTVFLWALGAVLAMLMLLCLFKALEGPRFTDRALAVNAATSLLIALMLLLTVLLRQDYLIDIALVFGMLSFLGTVALARLAGRPDGAGKGKGGRRRGKR